MQTLKILDTHQYDTQGNLAQVSNASGTNIAGYQYSPTQLLDSAGFISSAGISVPLTNTWDADSNRVGMTNNGQSYSFVYDVTAGIPAVIEEEAGSSATAYYIREPDGTLIARFDPNAGDADPWRYYHFDELGSTRLLTDGNGVVTDRYGYDAYGALLWHEEYANSIDQLYQYVGALGYYTPYQEPELGLLRLGLRFYDPLVGRFTQRDVSVSDGAQSYGYVADEATQMVDPTGMVWCQWVQRGKSWALDCHWGHKSKRYENGWDVDLDKLLNWMPKKLRDKLQPFVDVVDKFDTCADIGSLFDYAHRCNVAWSSAWDDYTNANQTRDPLALEILGRESITSYTWTFFNRKCVNTFAQRKMRSISSTGTRIF